MVTLAPGLEVKIQRTNGAIHAAQVTGVDFSKNLVTVEWPEGDDIKGKEVDIDMIYRLNPSVLNGGSNNNGTQIGSGKTTNGNSSSVSPRRDADRGFKVSYLLIST